eukprot:scaffold11562_cov132-Isochrysis_galbana.AAC.2
MLRPGGLAGRADRPSGYRPTLARLTQYGRGGEGAFVWGFGVPSGVKFWPHLLLAPCWFLPLFLHPPTGTTTHHSRSYASWGPVTLASLRVLWVHKHSSVSQSVNLSVRGSAVGRCGQRSARDERGNGGGESAVAGARRPGGAPAQGQNRQHPHPPLQRRARARRSKNAKMRTNAPNMVRKA